jgi:hypothetical protein
MNTNRKPLTSEEILQHLRYISNSEKGEIGKAFFEMINAAEIDAGFNLIQKHLYYSDLGDGFSSFYHDTIIEMLRHKDLENEDDEESEFTLITHIVSLRRLRAAYTLFIKGYYAECVALSRGLLENALILIALHEKVLSLAEARPFPPRVIESHEDPFEVEILLQKKLTKISQKVTDYYISNSKSLSRKCKSHLKSLLLGMHNAVHRSNLAIWQAYSQLYGPDRSISIVPEFIKKDVEQAWNLSWFSVVCLNKTFELFSFQTEDEIFKKWNDKYQVSCKVLDDFLFSTPAVIYDGLREFYSKTFSHLANKK